MTTEGTPLTLGEQHVLTVLADFLPDYKTLDALLAYTGYGDQPVTLKTFTRTGLARTLGALQRKGCTSKITTGGKASYKITPHGQRSLAAKQQPGQPAEWAGYGFTAGAGEITIPCEFVKLEAGEGVCTFYDLPGTSPILALCITTSGRLMYGVRAGEGWAFEPQWVGICGARPSQLQDVLEQVTAELHVIDRQNYPSTLREHLRKQLRLQTAATLADLEAIFRSIPRGALIAELARMRDDGEIRFQGPRYIWTGKVS